ncbi:hypothetical protein C0Q70_12075 [Pomacea canaliculata]|uniref:Uncharacterized protein n=1 Tax=Pomacea canaliculata TaxID=400727 RepID=A0A2T7P0H0_POMCA|nr:hypothetical protein C0Q70_12075 [Pomacea canaliculata]
MIYRKGAEDSRTGPWVCCSQAWTRDNLQDVKSPLWVRSALNLPNYFRSSSRDTSERVSAAEARGSRGLLVIHGPCLRVSSPLESETWQCRALQKSNLMLLSGQEQQGRALCERERSPIRSPVRCTRDTLSTLKNHHPCPIPIASSRALKARGADSRRSPSGKRSAVSRMAMRLAARLASTSSCSSLCLSEEMMTLQNEGKVQQRREGDKHRPHKRWTQDK